LIAGARGGQGTTTVATVIAAFAARHRQTTLVSTRPDDVCALTGTLTPPKWFSPTLICPNMSVAAARQPADSSGDHSGQDDASVVVSDLGRLSDLSDDQAGHHHADACRWLVVRGPCYVSLRAAIDHPWRPDGIVLLVEPGRPLSGADVTDVLGAPIVAQVPVEAAVARAIDAGLLLARLDRLSAFLGLSRLLRSHPGAEATTTR
ncbi:MAG: hypothetical protein M3450_17275, partial [Actinomycetota bacterium]|nr:hypothetical protein [Actinomycetota bacterium]